MTERGAFFVHRGIWEHTSFDDEPFTQREAWIWLISEAAYRPFKKRIAGHVIELQRGQVCHSQRFLAKAWGWTDSKVRRFLDRLKTDAMIDAETTQSYSIITICNYDAYQDFASQKDAETDAPFDAAPTQHRRSTDANYKTTKTTKTKDTTLQEAREPVEIVVEPAKAQSLVSPDAFALADELAMICGHKPEFVPPAWCGAGMWVQKCLAEGWTPDEMREGTRGVVARGRKVDSFRYLEKPLADFVASNRAPLHVGEARGQGPPGRLGGGNLVSASDRLLEKIQAMTGDQDGDSARKKIESATGVGARAAPVRLLSSERRG